MSGTNLRLHLGCGKRYIPGFTHIDRADFPHIDHRQDIRSLGIFSDETAELIYACQVIDYFDRLELPEILAEWKRVLAPGGILRLSVPNFATIARLYQAGLSLDWMLGTLYGRWPDGDGGSIFKKTTFDEPALEKILRDAGFTDVELWDWRQTDHAAYDDFSQAYFPHMEKERGILWNLNMQARKP